MKRKVLAFFSFLLLLLAFLTLVSPKVEEEMLTLAEAKEAKAVNERSMVIYSISFNWEDGKESIFILNEGEGWESGLRVAKIPPEYYDHERDHVTLGPGQSYLYVYSASRMPVLGSEVRTVETWRAMDDFLVWYPEEIGDLAGLPYTMTVRAKTENAALISASSVVFPFFEHNVWIRFKDIVGSEVRIYSMHDVRQFAAALPWIAGTFAVLLCSLILMAAGWRLSGRTDRGKWSWFVNIPLIAGMLVALPGLLDRFDLPASLMPKEYILDIRHYTETFARITSSMKEMGDLSVQDLLSRAGTSCLLVMGAAVLAAAVIILLETWLFGTKRSGNRRK